MMKKLLFTLAVTSLLTSSLLAQDSNLDKKVRFGLRVTPQPTWFVSDDKNNIPAGAKFGFGFGLNMEFRLSEVAALLTGIGGDFEGGKYTFRNNPANNYQPMYIMNENNELVVPSEDNKFNKANTAYILKDRTFKTTYVTIPFILKLSTKEYNGLKYYGMFGAELGIRLGAKSTDTYYGAGKYSSYTGIDTVFKFTPVAGIESQSDIDIAKESAGVPMRLCFNAGLGTEYRLSGSTAVFVSVNYFRGLSNIMRKESEYTYWKTEQSTGKSTFIKQNLKMSGIRISVGIMF